MQPALDHHQEVLRAHRYHALRVKRVIEETADARSYVLEVPDDLAELFAYRPGQFLTFRVHIGGRDHLRSYSMSSAPETDTDLTVTVKRVTGGAVSNWLLDQVSEGDVLEVTKPAGVFCPRARREPVIGFCGGSGITPLMSIIKSVLASSERPVTVLYANRDRDSVIFEQALEDLGRHHPGQLVVQHHLDCESGFLTREAIVRFAESAVGGDFYVCGPGLFMDLVQGVLVDLGVEPERVFIERFNVDEPPPLSTQPGRGDPGPTATLTLILKGKATSTRYHVGDTILEAARRAGLKPPSSCEAGNCATCMAFLREGTVRMRANNALTSEEVEEGWVLTCQSVPISPNVTVDYESV